MHRAHADLDFCFDELAARGAGGTAKSAGESTETTMVDELWSEWELQGASRGDSAAEPVVGMNVEVSAALRILQSLADKLVPEADSEMRERPVP